MQKRKAIPPITALLLAIILAASSASVCLANDENPYVGPIISLDDEGSSGDRGESDIRKEQIERTIINTDYVCSNEDVLNELNNDNTVNINDVTLIQKYIAKVIDEFPEVSA